MKQKINSFFEEVADIITGMSQVTAYMLVVMFAGCFFAHVFFYRILPPDMSEVEKQIASWLLGIAWEATVLTTTTNGYLLKKNVNVAMSVFSGLILWFFVEIIPVEVTNLTWWAKVMSAPLISLMNFVYTYLFTAKWKEHKEHKEQSKYEAELTQAHLTISHLQEQVRSLHLEVKKGELKATRDPARRAQLMKLITQLENKQEPVNL